MVQFNSSLSQNSSMQPAERTSVQIASCGATFGHESLMLTRFALQGLAVQKVESWQSDPDHRFIRNPFSPRSATDGPLANTARTRSSFRRETPRMRSSTFRKGRPRSALFPTKARKQSLQFLVQTNSSVKHVLPGSSS